MMFKKVTSKVKEWFPAEEVSAHCDGPCGVYDPASARIAAEAASRPATVPRRALLHRRYTRTPTENVFLVEGSKSRAVHRQTRKEP